MIEFSPPDDYFYVNNIKNGIDVDNSINQLAEKHIALISKTFYRYGNHTGIAISEMLQDAPLLVWRSAESFDPSRATQYSSWLASQSRFYALNMTKPAAKFFNQISTDPKDLEFIDNPATDDERKATKKQELYDYIMFLAESYSDPQIKIIMKSRYFGDRKNKDFKSIGQILGITGQATKNIHDHFLKLVRKKISAKDFLDFI